MAIDGSIVKAYGIQAGAAVVGIAAAEDFTDAPDGFKPSDVLQGCRSVIVLGAASPSEALNDIDTYTAIRNATLAKMTDMAKAVAKRVKADGYSVKAVSASGGKYVAARGGKEQWGDISLKHAAQIAGLGVIGKNYLLTNSQYGNLLWFSAVLTDAPLTPDSRETRGLCGDCDICVKACPTGALNDLAAFGKKGCAKFYAIEGGKLRIKCFACRAVCPYRLGAP